MSAQSAQELEKGLGRLKIPGRECQADRALPIRNLDYQNRNTMPGRWLRVIGRLCASSHNEVARASQTPVGWGRRRLKIGWFLSLRSLRQIMHAAYDRIDRDDDAKVANLAPARVPDRTRRDVIAAFTPHHMGGAEVIDADGKQVAKWEEETVGQDVIVSAHGAAELRFRRPGRPAVGGSSVEGIPKKMVLRVHFSRVHPCDPDVARGASGHSREAVLHAKRGV